MPTCRNEIAPAEVEGSTGAVADATRGDGFPLPQLYMSSTTNNNRVLTYVNPATGQASTYLARPSDERAHCLQGGGGLRLLAHDTQAPAGTNAALAKVVASAVLSHRTARTVPMVLMATLVAELDARETRIRELGVQLSDVREQLGRALSRSDN